MSSRHIISGDDPDLAQHFLAEGFAIRLPVTGTSMYPVLRDGERIIVETLKPGELSSGMVIGFSSGGKNIAHRVVKLCDDDMLITRGDFYRAQDTPIHLSQVLGKVSAKIPAGYSRAGIIKVRKRSAVFVNIFRPFNKIRYRISRLF